MSAAEPPQGANSTPSRGSEASEPDGPARGRTGAGEARASSNPPRAWGDHANAEGPSRGAQRLIVGISGASGTVYGIRLLEVLRDLGFETHVVMTRSARLAMSYETSLKPADVEALATVHHRNEDVAASISSGSFRTLGMVVAPCSIRSLSEISTGVTSSLLTRAADVVLKERRRLVLMVRETPLHLGHLRSMTQVTEIGAIVMPPVPALYNRPQTVDDIVDHTIGRVLDLFGIDNPLVRRWGESEHDARDLAVTGRKA